MDKFAGDDGRAWPALPLEAWKDTYDTLHMWTQIAGKIRLALSPPVNHWWEVVLYVSARGLTTSAIPYHSDVFEIRFDFLDHHLAIETSWNKTAIIRLRPMPVAEFYREVRTSLADLGIDVSINPRPSEVPDPIPFSEDSVHASYDPAYVGRFWHILISTDTIFKEFRSRFIGKCSPVHFFWGSFDLAVTRFSGRRAPERPNADAITREAYSHEVISTGFWPGSGEIQGPAYYAYAAPVPPGLETAIVRPETAFYHKGMSEFLLMYDDVRQSASPRHTLLDFLQSTYEECARFAGWDRAGLERQQ
jgi:hypothetical protein